MIKKANNRKGDHMYNMRKANTFNKTWTKKPNNRETDHLYNTRKIETVDENHTKKVNNRDTDHIYDTRKAGTWGEAVTQKINGDTDLAYVEETPSRKLNNRDTDHMYNMRKAKTVTETLSHEVHNSVSCTLNAASTEGHEMSECTTVDKRVVDKDHMYQHNVRKLRNKSENRSTVSTSQHQSASSSDTAVAKKKRTWQRQISTQAVDTGLICQVSLNQETLAGADDSVHPNKLLKTGGSTGACPVNLKEKNVKVSECDQRVYSMFMDSHPIACPLTEHGYTLMEMKESAVLDPYSIISSSTNAAAAKQPSPVHSDSDSDHTYEDDSRRMSVFHTDHMYVHADYLDNDILDKGKGHIMAKMFSTEGYKQEHSYANSEEIHYDACKNCSELVQQLIGTIRQQRNEIDDLRKQLQAANVKNKWLSLMCTCKPENVNWLFHQANKTLISVTWRPKDATGWKECLF